MKLNRERYNRFKTMQDPVKMKPWNSTLDATVPKEGCRQFSIATNDLDGTEDCLFNNIYTPMVVVVETFPSSAIKII